jgi:hypothetical protein
MLASCSWYFYGNSTAREYEAHRAAQVKSEVPITVEQFVVDGNIIPVELRCEKAELSAPNRLETFTCRLRNNTRKNIVAANVTYSVVLEENGVKSVDTRSHTLDTSIHPDFYEPSKSIAPQGERIITPPGPSTYEGSVVTGVEVKVDYVEFDDKAKLGDNLKAEQIIDEVREGAARYKAWLVMKYIAHGKLIESITPALMQDEPLPKEFKDTRLDQGASAYRARLRRVYETHGAAALTRYLDK